MFSEKPYAEQVDYLEKVEHQAWLALEARHEKYERSDKDEADKRRLAVVRAQHNKSLEALLKRHTEKLQDTKEEAVV